MSILIMKSNSFFFTVTLNNIGDQDKKNKQIAINLFQVAITLASLIRKLCKDHI